MKLYFPTPDAEYCYNLAYFDMLMEEMGVTEMKVWPSKADIGGPGFFCAAHEEVGERGNGCKDCPEYEARNKYNGICKHWRFCRVPDETPVTLKSNRRISAPVCGAPRVLMPGPDSSCLG